MVKFTVLKLAICDLSEIKFSKFAISKIKTPMKIFVL